MKTEKERLHFSARVAGIDYDEAEVRVTALLIAQRDRFEQAYALETGGNVKELAKWHLSDGIGYKPISPPLLYGAWIGWQMRERLSGNDPFMGFLLEGANEGEMAAYDYGCRSCEDAVRRVIEGDDKGEGACNEPWNNLRNQLLRLKADAERWRKMSRISFKQPAFSAVVIAPGAFTKEGHDQMMNEWIDGKTE